MGLEAGAGEPAATALRAGRAVDAFPVAEALGVSKHFGASQALRDVSLVVPAGDSRALVGRNGAGKSTLVGVLTGLLPPDEGKVRFAGQDAPRLADRERWRERVACVYQKSTVIPTLTVAENLFLNAHPGLGGGFIAWRALRRKAGQVLAEWGLEIDVELDAERLTVEQRQIVEIARALLQGTRFIILDEPTAQLEGREVARLFERIARLQEAGVTFLYISHHLEEIYEVCQSVTVLRDGEVVANAPLGEMPQERVVAAMVGDALRAHGHGRPAARAAADGRPPCLDVRALSIPGAAEALSFAVAAGEIVGLAGLAGSGKEQVGDAVAGLVTPAAGEIRVAGAALRPGLVADARRKGVGYVPRDRHRRGIVPQLSLGENLTLTIIERLGPWGFVRPAVREREASKLVSALEIVAASTEQPIGELSGGNQQKAVMGRALASAPKLLMVANPTQGVDIASKDALFDIIEQARAGGTGVLLVSDDLDELVVCDRVLVIFRGRLVAEFGPDWRDHELVAAIEGVAEGG
jgi:simple sugar transport system ATP-binding protein